MASRPLQPVYRLVSDGSPEHFVRVELPAGALGVVQRKTPPPADVGPPPEAFTKEAGLAWFCVRTGARREIEARNGLCALGLIAYLPMEATIRGRSEARERVDAPFIPRHLFMALEPHNTVEGRNPFQAVLDTRGVERILANERFGPPSRVPRDAIVVVRAAEDDLALAVEERLAKYRRDAQAAAEAAIKRAANPKVLPDDTAKVVAQLQDARPDDRIDLLLALLGRGARAKISLAELQTAG